LQLIRQTGKSSAEVTFKREEDAKAARANIHRWVSVLADLAISFREYLLGGPACLVTAIAISQQSRKALSLPPKKCRTSLFYVCLLV
jgi:hypothetical protein